MSDSRSVRSCGTAALSRSGTVLLASRALTATYAANCAKPCCRSETRWPRSPMSSDEARAVLRRLMKLLRIHEWQTSRPAAADRRSLHGFQPSVDFALGIVLGVAVALLQTTGE